jgi:cardiolipin synthase (CMP-forming)
VKSEPVRSKGLARLLGLRRDFEPPPQTRAGQPLRPLTLPNFVGYSRVVLVCAFLLLAVTSDDGRVTAAAVCYGVAAAGDYLDGLLARVTGQYSRLGALMDPLVDRALILSGAIVSWKFELLPRWALGVLAARELVMIVLVGFALGHGLDVEINWTGRFAVWPTMAGIGGALIADLWLAEALLYVGIAGALAASALYLRDGLEALRSGADAKRPAVPDNR